MRGPGQILSGLALVAAFTSGLTTGLCAQMMAPDPRALRPVPGPWIGAPVPPPPPPPMTTPRILNDTPEYCAELMESVERIRNRMPIVSDEALTLANEGAHMCQIGHYRPGVARLRTALVMMRRGK